MRIILGLLFSVQVFGQETFDVNQIRLQKKISCTAVKDQSMSSTCWSFASTSFLEAEMIRKGIPVVDLSEMYIARLSYLNKINKHLQEQGKTFFTPGGQFHDVVKVVKANGLLPEIEYSGKPVPGTNHDHSELDTLLKYYVKDLVTQKVTHLNHQQSRYVDSVLDVYLGVVPKDFFYKGKKYDAVSFAKKVVQLNMEDYVEITSYTHHPMYTGVILEDPYNWSKDKYYNVPYVDFVEITNQALAHQFSIGWDGDITERGFDYANGTAMEGRKIPNLEKYRNRSFLDSVSTIDHMMHIVGVGQDHFKNKWYYVKNSWGTTNTTKGYLFMDADYFAIKTVAIIIHKNAIPPKIRKKMGL